MLRTVLTSSTRWWVRGWASTKASTRGDFVEHCSLRFLVQPRTSRRVRVHGISRRTGPTEGIEPRPPDSASGRSDARSDTLCVVSRGGSAPVRAALYARQSVQEDQGIAQQLADTRSEAERRGWPVVAEYVDNDTSGSRRRAGTGWGQMLAAFDAGDFDALIVTEASRLTRSSADVLEVRPPKRNVRIIVIRQGVDTAVDDFGLRILVLIAEQEVKIKAERAARYAAARRAEGHPTSGLTPYGYRWLPASERGPDGSRLKVVDEEADVVRSIFEDFLAGSSMGQIARDLNAAGFRTRKRVEEPLEGKERSRCEAARSDAVRTPRRAALAV